ncbi:MAG: sporulation transcriptional regulator SpoIIID [Clostridia bacterium]|nr:sporulation transcriptional regulator SpoIIID [Clostridia bacterium]
MQHQPSPDFVLSVAQYYISHHSTVRDTANHFDISKSSVHNYLTRYLPNISPQLYHSVYLILKHNNLTKHLRGGDATRLKFHN